MTLVEQLQELHDSHNFHPHSPAGFDERHANRQKQEGILESIEVVKKFVNDEEFYANMEEGPDLRVVEVEELVGVTA